MGKRMKEYAAGDEVISYHCGLGVTRGVVTEVRNVRNICNDGGSVCVSLRVTDEDGLSNVIDVRGAAQNTLTSSAAFRGQQALFDDVAALSTAYKLKFQQDHDRQLAVMLAAVEEFEAEGASDE